MMILYIRTEYVLVLNVFQSCDNVSFINIMKIIDLYLLREILYVQTIGRFARVIILEHGKYSLIMSGDSVSCQFLGSYEFIFSGFRVLLARIFHIGRLTGRKYQTKSTVYRHGIISISRCDVQQRRIESLQFDLEILRLATFNRLEHIFRFEHFLRGRSCNIFRRVHKSGNFQTFRGLRPLSFEGNDFQWSCRIFSI